MSKALRVRMREFSLSREKNSREFPPSHFFVRIILSLLDYPLVCALANINNKRKMGTSKKKYSLRVKILPARDRKWEKVLKPETGDRCYKHFHICVFRKRKTVAGGLGEGAKKYICLTTIAFLQNSRRKSLEKPKQLIRK